jgi:hypothetical protein
MYQKVGQPEIPPENFELPFNGQLSSENRWVIMASLIPWSEFESEYANLFSAERGAPALSFRIALGALIIKEKLGVSDRETVEQIRENPYLQYFIGINSYNTEAPFDPSMLVHFRARIGADLVNKVNYLMVKKNRENTEDERGKKTRESEEKENRGKLIIDATCAPADISYPTDLNLLNRARIQTEKIINILYSEFRVKGQKKPKTSPKKARQDYLEVAKKRRPSQKQIRKALKKQLKYVGKNLTSIEVLITKGARLEILSKKQYKTLLVVSEIYRQQQWMFENNKRSIENRIVSCSQPHVRPIVRGKAGKSVEFGAKLSASCFDGYIFLDRISWENFNESVDLKAQVEAFKSYTGFYPESVHADQIYRTRENRKFCQERGIRISGPPLGRPPANVSNEQKKTSFIR